MITNIDYDHPLGVPGGYFNGLAVRPFPDYLTVYHIHFMRYIYYLCIMNAEGEYPEGMNIEEIIMALEQCRNNNCKKCRPRIKKILIGEAPPPGNPINYFYNTSPLRWNAASGGPTTGQAWTSAIRNTLFPGIFFPNTVSFLQACAREGFLLLDLFPYDLNYNNRDGNRYRIACLSAFGFGAVLPNPYSIQNILNNLICCIQKKISIGFSLKSFGEHILTNHASVANFNLWATANGISLNPPHSLDEMRIIAAPFPRATASAYLRVCGIQGSSAPNPTLLNKAGF